MQALMWFRSDLRFSDHTALHHACRSAQEGVIAVVAACPAQWSDHGWGSMKVNFILRNLQALSRGLSERNIPLLLVEPSSFAAVLPRNPGNRAQVQVRRALLQRGARGQRTAA